MAIYVSLGNMLLSLVLLAALVMVWRRGTIEIWLLPIIVIQQVAALGVSLFNDTPTTFAQWTVIFMALCCGLTFGILLERRLQQAMKTKAGAMAPKNSEAA